MSIAAKPGKGDDYIVPESVDDIFTGKTSAISHKEGQVLLIDFWATWCPPCQAPMAHNQDMLVKNEDKWGSNVRIVGLSCDGTAEVVKQRVEEKDWKRVEHYWSGGRGDLEACKAKYGVNGIPHVVLIDKKGKVAYAGHPMRTNLEKDINDLLEGSEIVKPVEESEKKESGEAENE